MAGPTLQEMKGSCDRMNKGKNSFSFFPYINCSCSYKYRGQSNNQQQHQTYNEWLLPPGLVTISCPESGWDPSSHPHEEMEGRGTKWASLKSDAEHDTNNPCVKGFSQHRAAHYRSRGSMWIFPLTFPLIWTTKSVKIRSIKKTSLILILL